MTDAEKIAELSEKYGADNPAIEMAKYDCAMIAPEDRKSNFWRIIEANAAYCNEEIEP